MSNIYSIYQLRAYTNKKGRQRLDEVLGMTRGLYNAALQERRYAYKMAGKSLSFIDQQLEFTKIRKEDSSWGSISTHIGRGALRRVERAYNTFFRRLKNGEKGGYPRYKSVDRFNTIELSEATSSMIIENDDKYHINIKGLPKLKLKSNRPLPDSDSLKKLSITERGNKIIVNLTYKVEPTFLPKTYTVVGLDMGVTDRITTSDGLTVPRVKEDSKRKKRLQRLVSRSKKGSNNRKKKVAMLANECYKQTIKQRNTTHRITTDLIRNYDVICVEKLDIQGMTQGVGRKTLHREILANRWGQIKEQLRYKSERYGKTYIEVDPKYTSQICSRCGVIEKSNRQGKVYKCSCGIDMDADLNASIKYIAAWFIHAWGEYS